MKVTRAHRIASRAAELVGGSRNRAHGDILENFTAIAIMWNAVLRTAGKPVPHAIDAHDVANMMEVLKLARRYSGAFNLDDYLDGAGYAAVSGEIAQRLNKRVR